MTTMSAIVPDPLVAAGKRQAISNAVNEAVSPITDFAVIVTIIYKGRLDIQIDPAREPVDGPERDDALGHCSIILTFPERALAGVPRAPPVWPAIFTDRHYSITYIID